MPRHGLFGEISSGSITFHKLNLGMSTNGGPRSSEKPTSYGGKSFTEPLLFEARLLRVSRFVTQGTLIHGGSLSEPTESSIAGLNMGLFRTHDLSFLPYKNLALFTSSLNRCLFLQECEYSMYLSIYRYIDTFLICTSRTT